MPSPPPAPSLRDSADALDLLEALPCAVAQVDAEGRVRWANPALLAALGRPAQAVLGVPLAELIAGPQGEPARREAVQRELRGGGSGIEVEIEGGRGWWRLFASPLGDGGAAVSLTDIGAEKAHERERGRLASLLDMAQEFGRIGLWERKVPSLEGRWDRHMFRFWGLEPTEGALPFKEAASRVHAADRLGERFEESLRQPGVYAARFRVRTADGWRQLHSQWQVQAGEDGRPAHVIGIMMDDTEVYRLARSVQDANAQLRLALDLADIALWRHDFATDRIYYDEQGFRALGHEPRPEGMSVDEVRSWIHPDDQEAVQVSNERALATGQPVDLAARYRHADGSWRDVLARRVVRRDAGGNVVGFIGVGLDVTEQVEQARRGSQLAQRLELAARRARIGLWSTSLEGPPDWSPLMFELFGLDPREGPPVFGEWLRGCVHAEDRARVGEQTRTWLTRGDSSFEIEFRVAGERLRWVSLRGDVESTAEGRRLYGVAMDVTEQHQTLALLRDAAERATLVASSVGIGTWEHDEVTGTNYWDAQMFRLRGLQPRADTPDPGERDRYVHPEDRERVRGVQDRMRLSDQPSSYDFRVVLPDGSVRWLASRSSAVLDEHGRVLRRIGVNWDITDSRNAELALRERELAQRESQAKSRFLARMSHELRTPLNAVLGFTQLVLAEEADDPVQRRRRLEHVRTAGTHLLSLINDVLDLSSLQGGEMQLTLVPVSVDELVADTLPLVEQAAQDEGVQLLTGPLEGSVRADVRRLRQVLLNLLSNAVKYNRRGGSVRVSTAREGSRLSIAVADTGRGIEPLKVQRLFEPFNRLGAEREGIEGTGIGLAIVKAVVEALGGELRVTSEPGRGSVFEVLLSAADAGGTGAPAPQAWAAGSGPGRPGRVLYVEDNAVNALIVAELLSRRPGLSLEIAADGQSGIASAQADPPQLVLVDMHLPDMDGHAVLQRLRADPRTAGVSCAALSANAMPDDIERALDAGFVAYWTKPLDFKAFLDWIDTRFGRPAEAGAA